MTRFAISALLVAGLLGGCGTHLAPTSAAAQAAAIAAASKKKSNTGRVDKGSFDAGVAAGQAKLTAGPRQGLAPAGAAAAATPDGMDKLSYEIGFVQGELQGALNAYNRIDGSFDVYQWKSFAYMLEGAMKDALATLQADPALTAKCGIAAGILTGGIQAFDAINGSFDVDQWQSFANSNRAVLKNALGALQAVVPTL